MYIVEFVKNGEVVRENIGEFWKNVSVKEILDVAEKYGYKVRFRLGGGC